MNLYFLDANNKQHLIAIDVSEEDVIPKMLIDLYNRYPDFKNYYQRVWWDEFHRMWNEDEKYALNVVAEMQDEKYAQNVVEEAVEEEKPACNRSNKDYCDI